MSLSTPPTTSRSPSPFSVTDYTARMVRTVNAAAATGLNGVLVGPGPDLVWLTGYRPTAITERLTLLMLFTDREPVLVVPTLERPDAAAATGAPATTLLDWADGTDPYGLAGDLLPRTGQFGISDSTWALHLLGLQQRRPDLWFRALTAALPMLRAVKDDAELDRLAAAGAAADAVYEQILDVRFGGRREID